MRDHVVWRNACLAGIQDFCRVPNVSALIYYHGRFAAQLQRDGA